MGGHFHTRLRACQAVAEGVGWRRLITDAAISGCWRTKDSEIAAAFTPFKLRKDIKEELPPDYDAWTLRFEMSSPLLRPPLASTSSAAGSQFSDNEVTCGVLVGNTQTDQNVQDYKQGKLSVVKLCLLKEFSSG